MTEASFRGINYGMTVEEAEAVLGRKPNLRQRGPAPLFSTFDDGHQATVGTEKRLYWCDYIVPIDRAEGGEVAVGGSALNLGLDRNDIVVAKFFYPPPEPTGWEQIRDWLRDHGL
jgi:hypothetical protein